MKHIVGKIAPWTKLNLIFKPVNKLKSLSRLKSSYKLLSHSKVVYRINCLDCEEFYDGMTERILQKRISEHEKLETSSVYIHSKLTNHNIDMASPVILAHNNVKLRLQVKETILIKEQGL